MKKEDVLEKARREGRLGLDEGSGHMKAQGRMLGQILALVVFVVLGLCAVISENDIEPGVLAMGFAYVTGEAFYEWKHQRGWWLLLLAVVSSVVAICAVVMAACEMFGVAL